MSLLLLALGLFGGLNEPAKPRVYRIEVVFCEGDPLGSKADGNVKHLAESVLGAWDGRPVFLRCGGSVSLIAADGKEQKVWLGTELEVIPVATRGGNLFVDVNARRSTAKIGPGAANGPVITEKSLRVTRLGKPGETFRIRLSADAPESQTWVQVTVTEMAKGK